MRAKLSKIQSSWVIAHMHLGGSHDIVQVISCSLLQSPAVLGHPETPVMSGNILNMSKNLGDLEICQIGRSLTPTASPTIAYASVLVGNDPLWLFTILYGPLGCPWPSPTVADYPGPSQAIPDHHRALCSPPPLHSSSPFHLTSGPSHQCRGQGCWTGGWGQAGTIISLFNIAKTYKIFVGFICFFFFLFTSCWVSRLLK